MTKYRVISHSFYTSMGHQPEGSIVTLTDTQAEAFASSIEVIEPEKSKGPIMQGI